MTRPEVDESNDQEPFYAIISSHLQVLVDQVMTFGQQRGRSHVQWNEWTHKAHTFFSQPATCATMIVLLACLLLVQTSHYWMQTFARRLPFKMISKRILTSGSGRAASNSPKLKSELRTPNAGLFAMQGRRPRMEDRFSVYLPSSSAPKATSPFKRLLSRSPTQIVQDCSGDRPEANVEMFAIYDGHGGEVSASNINRSV
jgi:hypothetical protein